MATISLKEKEIIKFKNSYKKFKISNTSKHADETYKFTGCTITLYKTGKIVFQGPNAIKSAVKWGFKTVAQTQTTHKEYIGSDEVGTGDFFGPIVVSACYVNSETSKLLEELGVGDSKKISDKKILKIAPVILKITKSETIVLNNEQYNKTILSHNMNEIKAFMHNSALLKLNAKVNSPINIVDEFASQKNYFKYLANTKVVEKNIEFHQKAESKFIGVAAASIIARARFIKEMEKLNIKYNLVIPFGAGNKIDDLIVQLDNKTLIKIGKLNFKNYKKTRH